ncbi:MAG: hypothetical protein WC455_22775 [Dehalococcoidia bacterium]|jgi:hypothetical protein
MTIDTHNLREAIEAFRDVYGEDTFDSYRRKEIERLTKKWAWYLSDRATTPEGKVIEMEPIPTRQWPTLACMLENQVLANPQYKSVFEATSHSDISLPVKFSLPLIRAIFPQLIMNKLCLIQPMPPSSGGTMQLFWKATYRQDPSSEVNVTTANSLYSQHATDSTVPNQLKIKITSTNVSATQDMLMAVWPTRTEEDLRGVMGLDLDADLINDMAAEIMRELEQRVIATMYAGATAGNSDWHWTKPDAYTSHTEYYQTLFHTFIDAEALIRAAHYRGADYIVAGATVLGYMEKANWFGGLNRDKSGSGPFRSAVEFRGTKGMWDVYYSPYLTATTAFMSFYPEMPLSGGYIWAPYIPFMPMPKIYAEAKAVDDETLPGALIANDQWTRRVRTRNAQYFCAPTMFATITSAAS